MKELNDVMSSSYSSNNANSPASNADPDLLQPQMASHPDDSYSEMNQTNSNLKKPIENLKTEEEN